MRRWTTPLVLVALAAAAAPADPPAALSPERLGAMLTDLAYEPRDVSSQKQHDVYLITTERDGWKVQIEISLSSDRTMLWFDVRTPPVPDASADLGDAWLRLLKRNADITPAYFNYNERTRRIHLSMTVENEDVTPVRLRRLIDQFDGFARRTEPDWRPVNFRPVPSVPPMDDAGRAFLERIDGAWEVIAEQRDGRKTPGETVRNAAIVYTFDSGKMWIRSAAAGVVEGAAWSDGREPAQLDLIFPATRHVQKALARLEGDTLTLCVADPGAARPALLSGKPGAGALYTLKRRK